MFEENGEPYPNTDFYITVSDRIIINPTNLQNSIESFGNKTVCPVIFIQSELLPQCYSNLLKVRRNYVLITTGNDDIQAPYILSSEMHGKVEALLSSHHLKAWFTKNPCIKHPKISPIPLGPKFQYVSTRFFGEPKTEILQKLHKYCLSPYTDFRRNKPNTLYFNFSVGTTDNPFIREHQGIRKRIREELLNAGFEENVAKPFEEYLCDIREHQFCVCPPGRGVDTHRCWEALMVGTVPIMVETALDSLYEHLPVVLVPLNFDWSKITDQWLNVEYTKLQARTDYDFTVLYTNYWRKKITDARHL